MINQSIIDNFNAIEVFSNFSFKIKEGGHYCKVLKAEYKKSKSNQTMLVVYFDFDNADEQKGLILRNLNFLTSKYENVSYPNDGTIYFNLENEHGLRFFKQFITCLIKNNPGFAWTWNEQTLSNKKFGAVFKYQKNEYNDKVKYVPKIDYFVNLEEVINFPLKDFENEKENSQNNNKLYFNSEELLSISNDDLPF